MINPLVFSEWCSDFALLDEALRAVDEFQLVWAELPPAALYLASQAHRHYRRRGGARAMILPDFLIGAHAAVQGWPLLTRDRRRFDLYFGGLQIVAP